MPALLMVHDEDPAHKIFRNAGNLDDIEVFNSQVLVGVYQRAEGSRTKGGIIISHKTTDEDQFQSKTGIILKMGPNAFRDEKGVWFKDVGFNVGDWIVFKASDGWGLTLLSFDVETGEKRELLCRLMDDVAVRMRISSDAPADRIY